MMYVPARRLRAWKIIAKIVLETTLALSITLKLRGEIWIGDTYFHPRCVVVTLSRGTPPPARVIPVLSRDIYSEVIIFPRIDSRRL